MKLLFSSVLGLLLVLNAQAAQIPSHPPSTVDTIVEDYTPTVDQWGLNFNPECVIEYGNDITPAPIKMRRGQFYEGTYKIIDIDDQTGEYFSIIFMETAQKLGVLEEYDDCVTNNFN